MGFGLSFLKTAAKDVGGAGKAGFHFLENTATSVINSGKNAADVLNAGRQGAQGLANIGAQSVFGSDKSYQNAVNQTGKAVDYSLNASRGTYTPEEAGSTSITKSLVKPIARGVATYAPYALGDVGGAAADAVGAASVPARLAVKAGANYALNTGIGVAGQAAQGQPVDLKKAAVGAVAPTVFGTALDVAPHVAQLVADHPLNEAGSIPLPGGQLNKLAKATTPAEVKTILKDSVPSLTLDKIAGPIAQTKDPNIISNIIDRATKPIADITSNVTPEKAALDNHLQSLTQENQRLTASAAANTASQDSQKLAEATVPKAKEAPQVVSQSPTSSPELKDLVKRGKLQQTGELAPIDSLKLGSDTKGTYDTAQVKKYVDDIKAGRTVDPVVIDSKGFVQDGKHRLEAMRQLGVKDVPTVQQIDQPKLSGAAQQSTLAKNASSDVVSATVPKPAVEGQIIPPTNDPVKTIVQALQGQPGAKDQTPVAGIKNLQGKQSQLYSAERSARLGRATTAGADLTGRDATYAQLGALKGALPRVDSSALVEHLKSKVSPDDVNAVLDNLRTTKNLRGYEPITAQNAVVKLFDEGKLPTAGEFDILQKALGSEFTDSIKSTAVDSLSNWQKVKNFGVQVLGMPKSVMASFDLSGGGRQGAVLGSRFPAEWADAQKNSVKYFASQDAYDKGMQTIADSENAPLYKKWGVNLGATGGHEEQFASTLAEKIPIAGRGIAASDRAYTGGLSDLRAGATDHIIQNLKEAGIDPNSISDKAGNSIGKFINTASGRGDLGVLEKHAQSLGEALFSPRLWKSRLDMLNPAYYAKLDPIARKYALQTAGSFAAIAGTVLTLAAAAGAKVETDPRSSDFLKIKVGDSRYDILGGFQQNLVFAWRQISGEKKSSITGKIADLNNPGFGGANRLSILSDLIQNKENPVISAATTEIKGQDKAGNQLTPSARATTVGNLFVPLGAQDTYQAIKNTGNVVEGVAKAAPGAVGIGVGTYGTKDIQPTAKQQAYIKQLKDKGAPKEQVSATTSFYQTLKTGPDRAKASQDINNALAANNVQKAQQIATDYNKKYAANFKDWVGQNKQYASDKTLLKDYNSNKLTLTAASLASRVKNVKTNPLYSATLGGK